MATKAAEKTNLRPDDHSDDIYLLNEMLDIINKYTDLYGKAGFNLKEFFDRLERHLLIQILNCFDGDHKKTSEFLNVKSTTMYAKCKKHEIKFVKKVF